MALAVVGKNMLSRIKAPTVSVKPLAIAHNLGTIFSASPAKCHASLVWQHILRISGDVHEQNQKVGDGAVGRVFFQAS
jgi:hypothetical protein